MNSVQLTGVYGGDLTHALSAWTSTSRELTEEKRNRIPGLLKMLATEGHHTPFEKSTLQFLIRVDTASHIQTLKHRIGVSVNGESARYKRYENVTFHIPSDWPDATQELLERHCKRSEEYYRLALLELEAELGKKRAKESARFFLPYANQLTLDVSFNFRSFMHFVGLRAEDDAQVEIQDIANEMVHLVRQKGTFNISLDAFGV